MAKNHGARQQKKVAKQKAKRAEKRSDLNRKVSTDPAIRLKDVADLPVAHAFLSDNLWKDGLGSAIIARQESEGRLIFAFYLLDVYCLGVKNALWKSGTIGEFNKLVESTKQNEPLSPVGPPCLAKIVRGAVDFAGNLGFRPHGDFRHAGRLLEGLDASSCTVEYTFGRDGKPFYIQGPNESLAQALAIADRVREAGGEYVAALPDLDGDFDWPEPEEEDGDPDDIELFDADGNPIDLPDR